MPNPASNNYQNLRDQNRMPVASGQSNIDATQSLPFLIDPVTGRILVDATGATTNSLTLYVETPVGAIDGVNKVYTTANTIVSVLSLSINGQFIHPADYRATGTTITFGTALSASLSGLPFTVVYSSGTAVTGGVTSVSVVSAN